MAEPQAERVPLLRCTIPLLERVRFAPLWIWLLTTSSWITLYLLYAYVLVGDIVLGRDFWQSWGLANLHMAVLIGYLPAAIVWGQRGAVRTLHALRPALRCSEAQFQAQLRGIRTFDGRHVIAVGLAGIAIALILFLYAWGPLFPESVQGLGEGGEPWGFWAEESARVGRGVMAWDFLRLAVVVSLVAVALDMGSAVDRRFSEIGEAWTQIDLVDVRPLEPLAERGLRSVLILIVAAVFISTFLLIFPQDAITIGALILLPVAAAAAMVGPVRGVHRRLQQEKQAQLDRIRDEIRAVSQAGPTAPQGRLADLITYEGRIESVNTWLFDRSTLLRFGLIVGTGISMIAGALVERVVDAFLG